MKVDFSFSQRGVLFDRFGLPSDTDFRFAMLIVTVIAASLYESVFLVLNVPVLSNPWSTKLKLCSETVYGGIDAMSDLLSSHQTSDPKLAVRFTECILSGKQTIAIYTAVSTILILGTAYLIYWFFPVWKIRWNKFEKLSREDAPEVIAYIETLCIETGLNRCPDLLCSPLNTMSSALVFGRRNCYHLVLSGGLITQFYTERTTFRAVLLHELAHLYNKDIDQTYLTISLWLAFITFFGCSTLLRFFPSGNPSLPILGNNLMEVSTLGLLVFLTRNAVLRSREVYADARAKVWDGPNGCFEQVLAKLSIASNKKSQWLKSKFLTHPNWQWRHQVLHNPMNLFHLGFWDAFGIGIALSIAWSALVFWIDWFTNPTIFVGKFICGFVCAIIGLSVLGASVCRITIIEHIQKKTMNFKVLPLGFVLGLLLGHKFYYGVYWASIPEGHTNLIYQAFSPIIWGILLLITTLLVFRWIKACSEAWLEASIHSHTPSSIYFVGLVGASTYFAVGISVLEIVSDLLWRTNGQVTSDILFYGIQHPITTLMLINLWALPLSVWFWRRWVSNKMEVTEAVPDTRKLIENRSLHLGQAIKASLAGGFIFCILLLITRISLRLWISETIRLTDEYKLMFYTSQIIVAALIQVGIAVRVKCQTTWLSIYHSIFAVFIASCVMTIGILGENLLFGGSIDSSFVWSTFHFVSNGGALSALLVVSILKWHFQFVNYQRSNAMVSQTVHQ